MKPNGKHPLKLGLQKGKQIWEWSIFFRQRRALKEIIHDSGDTWNRASNRVGECKNLDSGEELSSLCCSGDCRHHLMEASWGLNVRRLPIIHEWIKWCNSNAQFFYIGQYKDRGLCNLPLTLSSTIYTPLHHNEGWNGLHLIQWSFIFFIIAAQTRQRTKASPLFNDKSVRWRMTIHFGDICIEATLLSLLFVSSFVPESFLSSRVPQLKLDFHPGLDIKRARIKIHPDRRIRYIAVNSVREAFQQRRLPHRGVPE